MGCSTSKDDSTPITTLCRQRRDLIRAAADRRFDFAAAHSDYFRSLDRVGEALHRFVTEELTVVSDPSSSPVLTLPPSEGKSKSKSDGSDGNLNGEFNVDGVLEDSNHHISISDSSESVSSSSSSGSDLSHLHFHEANADQNFGSEPNSFRSFDAGRYSEFANPNYLMNPNEFPNQFSSYSNPNYLNPNYYSNAVNGGQFGTFQNPNYYPNAENGGQFGGAFSHYNFHYMKKTVTIPSTFYVNPNVESFRYTDHYETEPIPNNSKGVHYARKSNAVPSTHHVDPKYVNHGYSSYYNDSKSMSREEMKNVNGSSKEEQPPPPPPDPKVSGWDFLNVFDTYEQYLTDYKESFRSGMSSSSPGSSEIREKEGIPDLEEETEPESFREGPNSGVGASKTAVLEEVDEEKVSNFVDESVAKEEEVFVRKKEVSFEEEEVIKKEDSCFGSSLSSSMVMEEGGLSSGLMLNVNGTKDVLEVVEEIKEQFKSAAECGEEVSKLLEVGKMRYRTRIRFLKVILSRVLDSLALSLSSAEHPSSDVRYRDANASKLDVAAHADCINEKSKNLSDTLDELYVWEKKLYKEIKVEEKLRVTYEKECRKLKALDDGGAESSKIDSTRITIKSLLTRINIAIKSVDATSKRIHKLRDEELRTQLTDLLQGLMAMWSSMLACHQKQFQAIAECKSNNLTARSRNQRNAIAKATKELEKELINWSSCFQNWIIIQKSYIESLNGWLMKWLIHEQEETSDGFVPFSPSRIGAPTVFILSNDWHNATERVSENNVITAMQTLADSVHRLSETQFEEQNQKLKAEYLSRDYYNRVKALNNGIELVDTSLDKRHAHVPNGDPQTANVLNAMRKRLDEEMAKHQEIVKHVREVTSSSLQMSLATIFEALTNYTTEMVRAYECLRIPRNGEGT